MNNASLYRTLPLLGLLCLCSCSTVEKKTHTVPADTFDLSEWKITVPLDKDQNGKVDEISVTDIQSYQHSDFFYIDDQGHMVFTTPNKATTTANSSNARSELRHMLAGSNKSIKTKSPANNFAIASHPNADKYGRIGGKMQATLHVNHVALNAGYPDKYPAHSVVVGQIHAGKDKALIAEGNGYGWGNEPLKIYYKKFPDHQYGSVFWNYERNLEKKNPNRTDIAYPVWGHTWENTAAPGAQGIALGEAFSYEVNVYQDTMYLTFTADNKPTVTYKINLANNIDAYGKVDSKDHPNGYTGDFNYFKAGAYNQCSTKDAEGFWYTKCAGTGDWETDKANGDYASVSFHKLVVGPASPPK